MNNVTVGEVGKYLHPLFDLEKCMELKDIEKNQIQEEIEEIEIKKNETDKK